MKKANWGVFNEAWGEFKRIASGWMIATIIYFVVSALLFLPILLLLWRIGALPHADETWSQQYVRFLLLGTAIMAMSHWLYCTAQVTLWPDEARSPVKETLHLIPHLFVIQAGISIITTATVTLLNTPVSSAINYVLPFLFILFLPLVVHCGHSTYRAIAKAPMLLFANPGHALLLVFVFLIGITEALLLDIARGTGWVGILLNSVVALFTVPYVFILTLLILDQIMPTERKRESQTENSASSGV